MNDNDRMGLARDMLEAAGDGMLSPEEAGQVLRELGAPEDLLGRLGAGGPGRAGSAMRTAGLVGWALRKCSGDRALMTAVLAFFVSCGSLFGYTAKSGDSFWKIARGCGCTVEELRQLNPQIKGDLIHVGDTIVTPAEAKAEAEQAEKADGGAAAEKQSGPTVKLTHVVDDGQSLSVIAKLYGVKLKDLIEANPQIRNPDLVRKGDIVNLPESVALARTDFVAKVLYAETSTTCTDEEVELVARVILNRIGDKRFGKSSNAYDVVSKKNAFSCTSGTDGNTNWSKYTRTLNKAAERDYRIAQQLMRGDASGLAELAGAVYYCNKSLAKANADEDSDELDGVKYGYPAGWESSTWKPVPIKATEHFVFYRVDKK